MTKKEVILAKDLCSRLLYGVIIKLGDYDYHVHGFNPNDSQPVKIHFYKNNDPEVVYNLEIGLKYYRPYLRPLDSMTVEERQELRDLCDLYEPFTDTDDWDHFGIAIIDQKYDGELCIEQTLDTKVIDWLNEKMFDYRGLIKQDLAEVAKDGMYNIKNIF